MSNLVPSTFTGSTQLNPSITTYEGLIKRIKHMFGYPLVEVEVSDEQLIDFINESIEYFTKYAGYTEEFLVFDTKTYVPQIGVNIEKLINSTCLYTISSAKTINVNVVQVPVNSYYYITSSSTVYNAVSSDSYIQTTQSYIGTTYLTNVTQATAQIYTSTQIVVPVSSNNYYLLSGDLYQSGSSINQTVSLTGELIQESIDTITPETYTTNITSVDVVNLEPFTYYTHESSLYRSGSSTSFLLNDTSSKGTVIQSIITTPLLSTFTTTELANVVDVPTDHYYVHGNSLWKSSLNTSPSGKAFAGTQILQNLSSFDIVTVQAVRDVNVVSLSSNTYYIHQNQLWYSGGDLGEVSLKGTMVNNNLLRVFPEVYYDSFSNEITAVPVPPNTIYFNEYFEGQTQLYRSGDETELAEGYSLLGDLVQDNIDTSTPFLTSVNVTLNAIESNITNSLYLNGTTVWRSGARIDATYTEAGAVYAANIPLGISFQEEVIDRSIEIVNVDINTYYISDGCLFKSCSSTYSLPLGYSEAGDCVVSTQLTVIEFFLTADVPGPSYGVVSILPDSYYLFNNKLIQSGEYFDLDRTYSLSGAVVQNNINTVALSSYVVNTPFVNIAPLTYYITGSTLYQSGTSLQFIDTNASTIGTVVLSSVYINPNLTTLTRTESASLFYDYDLASCRKIIDCFSFNQGESTGINTLFTLEQAMAQQIYSSYMVGNFGFDLVSWEALKGFVDTRNKVLAQTPHFRFDNRTQNLRIIPEPRTEESYLGLVGCYIERPIKDLVKERWVYDYSKALTMIAVGNVRGKYNGTSLFGGGSVNGNDLRQQGLTEKDNLEKVLITEYRDNTPPMFFIG